MTTNDLILFFEARPSVTKRGFADEAKVPERTFMLYLSKDTIIPEERADTFDRLMRSKYNYDYKAAKTAKT